MPRLKRTDGEAVPLMTRLPRSLHAAVRRFSEGNGKRPRASLNDTVIFLLTEGLRANGVSVSDAETPPGNRAPKYQTAHA